MIPYDEYIKVFPNTPWKPDGDLIPQEVVGMTIKNGYTLIRAWREYLGMTLSEVAEKMHITSDVLSQIESGEKKVRSKTIEKLSKALGLTIEQLR